MSGNVNRPQIIVKQQNEYINQIMLTYLIHPVQPRVSHLWKESPLGPLLAVSLCGKPFDGASSFRSVLQEPGPKAKPCGACHKVSEGEWNP